MSLLQIGALGFGGGVAGRSLLRLSRTLANPTSSVRVSSLGNVRPEIRVPPAAWNEKEKQGASGQGPPADMMQYISNMLPDISTTQPLGDWWGPTAALGTGAAALAGGYTLTDWLLDKERSSRRQTELKDSEREYQNALSDEYRTAMMAKQAGDDLGVDELYDATHDQTREKQADFWSAMESPYRATVGHDALAQFKGWLLAGMAATAAGTGYAMYNHTKGQSRQKLLEQAMQARARRRAAMSPSPPLAITPLPGEDEEVARAV